MLAASRGMIGEENRVFEPNRLMGEVVGHTHYLPRHWRNLAHNQEVQARYHVYSVYSSSTRVIKLFIYSSIHLRIRRSFARRT